MVLARCGKLAKCSFSELPFVWLVRLKDLTRGTNHPGSINLMATHYNKKSDNGRRHPYFPERLVSECLRAQADLN